MKIGIVTLVSDNYGNKYQNYAVEQLLSEYGTVETYGLEDLYQASPKHGRWKLKKIHPSYIREVLISRPMYRYDINRVDKGIFFNLIYAKKNAEKLLELKNQRSDNIKVFVEKYLHVSGTKLNRTNTSEEWSEKYDFFICGSDQIWNPSYATTSELAFGSFAPEKIICLSPSFGVSSIPEFRKADFSKWLKKIKSLSVREEDGQNIIKELTGRNADILLDPTMILPVGKWDELIRRPKVELPEEYIVCYFLGRITKEYYYRIRKIEKELGIMSVMLFDITTPQYYTFDPAEVLYTIKHARVVLTDSFHGTVFSILFHKNFSVFIRNEGAVSMNSRLETLLKTFNFQDRYCKEQYIDISEEQWDFVENILQKERTYTKQYLERAIQARRGEQKGQISNLPIVYSGFLRDNTKLMRSASGGAATAIAEEIIRQGGCVFGVSYTEDFKSAEYICCETFEDLEKIKGSKYTETKKNFPLLVQRLQEGRTVLFIGLGCDVAVAYSYCKAKGVSTEKLYTIDIICHGPVPEIVHRRFIEDLEKKYHSKVVDFTSRSKRNGWSSSSMMKATFKNGKVFENLFDETDYGYVFNNYALYRCTNCHFKGNKHQGDLCIGDHWGLSSKDNGWNQNGVSILIEQSDRGRELIEMFREQFQIIQTDAHFALNHNSMYEESRISRLEIKELISDLEYSCLHEVLAWRPDYVKWKRKKRGLKFKRSILQIIKR